MTKNFKSLGGDCMIGPISNELFFEIFTASEEDKEEEEDDITAKLP
jgi:hypothetical protein